MSADVSRPIRILHLFARMNHGGAELRTLELTRHMRDNGFLMDFCALSGRTGTLDDEIAQLGGEVFHLPLRRVDFPARFVRLLRTRDYDVVHSHVHHASGWFLSLAARCGVPGRIAHFRTSGNGQPGSLMRRWWTEGGRRGIDRHATSILAVSQYAMETAWRSDWHADPRCQVVYNGISHERFVATADPAARTAVRRELGIGPNDRICVHVGRFDRAKNHRRLLQVFREVAQRDPSARLVLVGELGKGQATIDAWCQADAVADRVLSLGRRDDVPRILSACDVMIFPSLQEGLPGAVLEACAAGVPIVASELPGVGEIAAHFPAVQMLPLAADNAQWAAAVMGTPLPEEHHRREALQRLRASPFAIELACAAFERVWQTAGAARRAA